MLTGNAPAKDEKSQCSKTYFLKSIFPFRSFDKRENILKGFSFRTEITDSIMESVFIRVPSRSTIIILCFVLSVVMVRMSLSYIILLICLFNADPFYSVWWIIQFEESFFHR